MSFSQRLKEWTLGCVRAWLRMFSTAAQRTNEELSLTEYLLKAAEEIEKLRQDNARLQNSLNENWNLGNDNPALREEKNTIQQQLENAKKELAAIRRALDSIPDDAEESDSEYGSAEMELDQPAPDDTQNGEDDAEDLTNYPIDLTTKRTAAVDSSNQPIVAVLTVPNRHVALPGSSSSHSTSPFNSNRANAVTEDAVPGPSMPSTSQSNGSFYVRQVPMATRNKGPVAPSSTQPVGNLHAVDTLKSKPGLLFICICGKTWPSRRGLVQHIRYYTDRRFSCTGCNKKIRGNCAFNSHLVNDHGLPLNQRSVIGCNICALPFSTMAEFHEHRQQVHDQREQRQRFATWGFLPNFDETPDT